MCVFLGQTCALIAIFSFSDRPDRDGAGKPIPKERRLSQEGKRTKGKYLLMCMYK